MIHSIIIEYVLCSNIGTQLLGRILISRRQLGLRSAGRRWSDWVFEFTLIWFWITPYSFFRIFVIYSRIRWRWFYSNSLFVSSAGGEDDVDSILIAISKDRWSFRAPFVLLVIVRDALIVRMDPPRHNTNASFSKPDKSSTFFLKDSYDIIMTPEIWWPW